MNSQDRLDAIKRKVKQGGLARIYLRENEQYILKRQSFVLKTEKKIFKLNQKLSLFYRGEDAVPKTVSLAEVKDLKLGQLAIPEMNIEQDLLNSLELALLKSKLNQIELKYELGENSLLPKLDLKIQTSRNSGDGDESLQETENKIILALEIPIERNVGQGLRNASMAQIRSIEMKKKYLKEKIYSNLLEIKNKWLIDSKLIKNYEREVEISKTLERAELRKFNQGVSDFFVVNLREQNTAEARISVADAKLSLFQTSQLYKAITSGITVSF